MLDLKTHSAVRFFKQPETKYLIKQADLQADQLQFDNKRLEIRKKK